MSTKLHSTIAKVHFRRLVGDEFHREIMWPSPDSEELASADLQPVASLKNSSASQWTEQGAE